MSDFSPVITSNDPRYKPNDVGTTGGALLTPGTTDKPKRANEAMKNELRAVALHRDVGEVIEEKTIRFSPASLLG